MLTAKPDAMTAAGDFRPSCSTDLLLPSDTAETRRVQDQIAEQLAAHAVAEQDIFSIRLALEEALVNAVKHGNQMDRSKKVRIRYRIQRDRFEAEVSDEGGGFDPTDVPDPTAVENLERPCGRGLMLMRYYMNQVEYNDRGNSVRMVKLFRTSPRTA